MILTSRLTEEEFYGQITAIAEVEVQLVLTCGTNARVTIDALETQRCSLRHQREPQTAQELLRYDERTILDTKRIRVEAQLRTFDDETSLFTRVLTRSILCVLFIRCREKGKTKANARHSTWILRKKRAALQHILLFVSSSTSSYGCWESRMEAPCFHWVFFVSPADGEGDSVAVELLWTIGWNVFTNVYRENTTNRRRYHTNWLWCSAIAW